MSVTTSTHLAVVTERDLAVARLKRQSEWCNQQEQRIVQLTRSLEAERDARRESYRGKLELLAEKNRLEAMVHYWFRAFFDLTRDYQAIWSKVCELRAQIFRTDNLMRNAKIKPKYRVMVHALLPLVESARQRDADGRSRVWNHQIMEAAGMTKSVCYTTLNEMREEGIIDVSLEADFKKKTPQGTPTTARFIKLSDFALFHPESLDMPKAPKQGGYRVPCPHCGNINTSVYKQSLVTTTILCHDCANVDIQKTRSPELLVQMRNDGKLEQGINNASEQDTCLASHFDTAELEGSDDAWERSMQDWRQEWTPPPAPEPVTPEEARLWWQKSEKAPPEMRKRLIRCPKCGGDIDRLRYGTEYVCAGCFPNPFARKGA